MLNALIRLLALIGMPLAGFAALCGLGEILRLSWGGASLLPLAAGLAGWAGLAVLGAALRLSLDRGPEASRWASPALDFLALRRLHPAVWLGLLILAVGPGAWGLHAGGWWILQLLLQRGRPLLLASGDVHDELDRFAVAYQFAWSVGVPVLFTVHLCQRWRPRWGWLPWALVPAFVAATAVAFVLVLSLAHLGD